MIYVRREGERLVVSNMMGHRGGKLLAKYPVGLRYPLAGLLSIRV